VHAYCAGGIHTFQFIYFFSSFWGQFGPNCTTFLLAGASSLWPPSQHLVAQSRQASRAALIQERML
jgi:hypothetical protein